MCAEYGNGNDDDTLTAPAPTCSAGCTARARSGPSGSSTTPRSGKAPENKVTPELAALAGSGLHPLVVFVDEIQELFLFGKTGKSAGETAEKCIKLFRALGIWLILGTQIPDKDSLPTGITRNINTRFCLSVADQVANDMILGTVDVQARLPGHRLRAGHRSRMGHPRRASASPAPAARSTSTTTRPPRSWPAPSPPAPPPGSCPGR